MGGMRRAALTTVALGAFALAATAERGRAGAGGRSRR